MVLAWEVKSKEAAIQAGREPITLSTEELWPDHIVEVKPTGSSGGDIVWEWHVWDHLIQDFDDTKDNFGVIQDHPELVDLNYTKSANPDWNHINSINYDAELDQIILSVWSFDEIWIIDHSTTTEESKGHIGGTNGKGGDLLYRWGNPMTYGKGALIDKKFFQQHNVHKIVPGLPNAGKIMLFNNGPNRTDEAYSAIEILNPIRDGDGNYLMNTDGTFAPANVEYSYSASVKADFFSGRFSSAQQLPNGNILVCKGPQGEFFELDTSNEIVWNYINPITPNGPLYQGESPDWVNSVFRVLRYGTDYPAFAGKTLTPQGNLELENVVSAISKNYSSENIIIYPNPAINKLRITGLTNKVSNINIYSLEGKQVKSLRNYNKYEVDVSNLQNGIYLISVNFGVPQKIIISR